MGSAMSQQHQQVPTGHDASAFQLPSQNGPHPHAVNTSHLGAGLAMQAMQQRLRQAGIGGGPSAPIGTGGPRGAPYTMGPLVEEISDDTPSVYETDSAYTDINTSAD
eukprot:2608251-Pleurochrysis_carterae.AAC.1